MQTRPQQDQNISPPKPPKRRAHNHDTPPTPKAIIKDLPNLPAESPPDRRFIPPPRKELSKDDNGAPPRPITPRLLPKKSSIDNSGRSSVHNSRESVNSEPGHHPLVGSVTASTALSMDELQGTIGRMLNKQKTTKTKDKLITPPASKPPPPPKPKSDETVDTPNKVKKPPLPPNRPSLAKPPPPVPPPLDHSNSIHNNDHSVNNVPVKPIIKPRPNATPKQLTTQHSRVNDINNVTPLPIDVHSLKPELTSVCDSMQTVYRSIKILISLATLRESENIGDKTEAATKECCDLVDLLSSYRDSIGPVARMKVNKYLTSIESLYNDFCKLSKNLPRIASATDLEKLSKTLTSLAEGLETLCSNLSNI